MPGGSPLFVSKLLLFVLYVLVASAYRWMYRKVQPGVRGNDWFIAATSAFALALGLRLIPRGSHAELLVALSTLLLLAGRYLLHLAFAELFEAGDEWMSTQLVLVGLGVVALCWPFLDHASLASAALVRVVSGAQYAITGWMVLTLGSRYGRLATWFAGSGLIAYAACHFFWFTLALLGTGVLGPDSGEMPAVVGLLAHSLFTFAFLLLAGARLRTKLEREANIDELTGLINLRAMRRTAARDMQRCELRKEEMGVVMIDLDNLKLVNDRLGHGAGDALLSEVASTLLEGLRRGDSLARIGGDEFCLLLPDATEDEAMRIAQKCRSRLLDLKMTYRGESIPVTASFGIAHTAICGRDWDELLRRGDAALYEAKREGKNRVVLAERLKKISVLWQLDRSRMRRRFESARTRL